MLPKAGSPEVFSDIPLFAEAVRVLGPKVFSMDNLPASLLQFGPDWWAEQCPGYDINFEWASNYDYGNPQKNRKRLFVIGAKSDLGFYFIPEGQKPGDRGWAKQVMQTGKFMPVEFTTYLSAYVKWFLEGNRPEDFPQATFERHIKPNQHIDNAKQGWCEMYGYACQAQACRFCGSRKGCPNV